MKRNHIEIYTSKNRPITIEAHFLGESVWVSQKDMADLFGVDRSVIGRHIRNVFASGELDEKSNVQKMHIAHSDRPVSFYSLDVAISVGYRVNSKEATEYRMWATGILKNYLVEGYAINVHRVRQDRKLFQQIRETILLIGEKAAFKELAGRERDLLDIISDYMRSWQLFEQYDQNTLEIKNVHQKIEYRINHYLARTIIDDMRHRLVESGIANALFGQERDQGLERILGSLEQTFDGRELYGSGEEKAAHLLYFVIKDHPFVDGNKRIASILFLDYLERNGLLGKPDGMPKFNDRSIVALALLIAVSDPKDKESLIKLIVNLIQD